MNLGTDLFRGVIRNQEGVRGRPGHSLETLSAVLGGSGRGEQAYETDHIRKANIY